jgi:hypothetical protein
MQPQDKRSPSPPEEQEVPPEDQVTVLKEA